MCGSSSEVIETLVSLTTTWRCDIEIVICLQGCDASNSLLIMLGDVFRGKATSTLDKRTNSMKLLCNMLNKVGLNFPCSATLRRGILCELRRRGAPPSRSKGILETIAFVMYTMCTMECELLCKGRRCWETTTSDEPVQRKHASPTQGSEVGKLRHILEHDTDEGDKLFCGTVLFMVYVRVRRSDVQHATQILFDRAEGDIHFAEVLTGHHKIMRALQHRHPFLPLIAPATGVTEWNWATLWGSVRDEMGISMDRGHVPLTALRDSGEPEKRALDFQEAGKWLRALLDLKLDAIDTRKASSCSMKCTMLSHLAKRGVKMSDILMLGYHTSPFTMCLTRSRNGMARHLQILSDMLTEMRKGIFKLDYTRSGRLVVEANKKPEQVAPASRDDTVKVESGDGEQDLNAWDLIPISQQCSLPPATPVESEMKTMMHAWKRPAVSNLMMAALSQHLRKGKQDVFAHSCSRGMYTLAAHGVKDFAHDRL